MDRAVIFMSVSVSRFVCAGIFSAGLCLVLQDGVNWLSFLNKYKLHGILCDDMGLGKTLQSICILAGDHYLRYTVQTAPLLLVLFDFLLYRVSTLTQLLCQLTTY